MSGPKSMVTLYEGFRARSKGSTEVTRPPRSWSFEKSWIVASIVRGRGSKRQTTADNTTTAAANTSAATDLRSPGSKGAHRSVPSDPGRNPPDAEERASHTDAHHLALVHACRHIGRSPYAARHPPRSSHAQPAGPRS